MPREIILNTPFYHPTTVTVDRAAYFAEKIQLL